ncbi:MAG: c-type cytochrome domain-containing protein [Bacteroidota bacterium]
MGNLHPLVLHLPIGIFVLAFFMELFYRKKPAPKDNGSILFALGISVLTSIFAALSGWLLSENGGYEENLLSKHKWIAIAFTLGTVVLFLFKKSKKKWAAKSYFPTFFIVLILLTLTGHYGGSLTHGEDFLFKEPYKQAVIEDVDEALVYADIVQPILDQKCVSCHNAGKAKGDLLLTSQKELLQGGASGSLLDSMEVEQTSLLMQRIHMPLEEEEHMPPKGKVQLTQEEIRLLEWWIENNHCFDCLVKNLEVGRQLEPILTALEKDTSPRALIAEQVDEVPAEFLTLVSQQRISIQKVSEKKPILAVNFLQRKDLTQVDFDILEAYKDNVVEMNLGHTNFNDTLGKQLNQFKNLTKLQLQRTKITNTFLDNFRKFEFLESLNLVGTALDDDILETLVDLKYLKSLYVWQTSITPEAIAAFQSNNSALRVQHQIADSIFTASSLASPTILANQEIFKDSLEVSIEQYFDGASIYYVLKDSRNDTLPKEYTGPFYIKESTQLTAYTTLNDWEPSEVASADFLKNQIAVKQISLSNPPHPKYTAQGGKTLMDLKRGTTNFVDGNWVGYEGAHMTATIEFDKPTKVSNISVGSLSIPNSWIFFPTGYTVWGSPDGVSFKEIKNVKLPKPEPSVAIEKKVYDIRFKALELKEIRLLVESPLKNPEWHAAPGGNSFIFLDEIVVN